MYVRSRPRISRENRTEEEDKIYDTWITKSLKLYNCFGKIWNGGELGISEIRLPENRPPEKIPLRFECFVLITEGRIFTFPFFREQCFQPRAS